MALQKVKSNKPPTKDEIKGRLIFGPIMIIGGILLVMFASYPKLQKANESKSWEQTQGEIIDVTIIAHKDGHAQVRPTDLQRYRNDEGNKYRVDIKYKYLVDTTWYTNDRKDLMQSKKEGTPKLRRAKAKAKSYEKNNKVTVFFNPKKPQESLLRQGLRVGQWLLVVSPLILLIVGFPIFFSGLKHLLFPKK